VTYLRLQGASAFLALALPLLTSLPLTQQDKYVFAIV